VAGASCPRRFSAIGVRYEWLLACS